uniref:Uncharacterized protein n=1 Tax=Ditylenchus dipsaci TaxID=166011 RepID=A0A915EUE4_9BILA
MPHSSVHNENLHLCYGYDSSKILVEFNGRKNSKRQRHRRQKFGSSAISGSTKSDHNSSNIEIHCDINVKIGSTEQSETAPSLSPFEITWQRFVAEGFSSLSDNQASLKEQLQRVEIKLNLYVQPSFAHMTPIHSMQDKIPVNSANQRMHKMMFTKDGTVNVVISVLYFNEKLWIKLYRTDPDAKQYFFYHAAVVLRVESFDEQTLQLDGHALSGPLDFRVIEEKRCLLLFKISPVRFNLEMAAESTTGSDDKAGAETDLDLQEEEKMDNLGDQGYFGQLLTCLEGDISFSDASSGQASIHTNALDGAPFLDDEMDIDVITVDDDAAMPLSETVLAEHKGMEGQVFEPITNYDDFANSLNDPDRTAFLGYSQSVENSRAASINEEGNNEILNKVFICCVKSLLR